MVKVMEIVVEKAAIFEYYKIQNDAALASLVSTTHIRQTGKSYVHAVTISLNGGIVRNNLNLVRRILATTKKNFSKRVQRQD